MRTEYFLFVHHITSSAPDALSTLVTLVVLNSLTRATLMSPGKDETRVCGYVYTSRLAGRFYVKLGIYWYLLLFDKYHSASTHFINLIFTFY